MIHWNIVLTFFHNDQIYQGLWKIVGTELQCIVVLQSRGHWLKNAWNQDLRVQYIWRARQNHFYRCICFWFICVLGEPYTAMEPKEYCYFLKLIFFLISDENFLFTPTLESFYCLFVARMFNTKCIFGNFITDPKQTKWGFSFVSQFVIK